MARLTTVAITTKDVWQGYLGTRKLPRLYEYMTIDDKAHKIHKVIVHSFQMGDVEDPDLFAAEPLIEWQNSEIGVWIMKHSVEVPMWNRMADPISFGHKYVITAWLKDIDYTFWVLKWAQNVVDKRYN